MVCVIVIVIVVVVVVPAGVVLIIRVVVATVLVLVVPVASAVELAGLVGRRPLLVVCPVLVLVIVPLPSSGPEERNLLGLTGSEVGE